MIGLQVIDEDREYTVDDFLMLDFDERVDLVDGKLVKMGWTNFIHARLVAWLCRIMDEWADSANWGFVAGGDAGVQTKVDPKQSARGADLVVISHERYAKVEQKGKIIDFGPELIIEVVSPNNTWDDIQTKIGEYFAIGTTEIWVVSPVAKNVTVHKSPKKIETYTAADEEIVTSEQLPGFELPLAKLAEKIDQLVEQS